MNGCVEKILRNIKSEKNNKRRNRRNDVHKINQYTGSSEKATDREDWRLPRKTKGFISMKNEQEDQNEDVLRMCKVLRGSGV